MKVNYPEMIIRKSSGINKSEEYVGRLCNDTFLSFWSFPNTYRNQGHSNMVGTNAKGDGKELCDLLVVFQNHIIIFSDKNCAFPASGNIEIDWRRWYKKSIANSAKQIYGAERWLLERPDSIFLDKDCSNPFPFLIPSKEEAVIHRIVIAQGASDECRKYMDGAGSLSFDSRIVGSSTPFTVGHINRSKGFIHIFDDVTLGTIMQTLDTVTDFITYLAKKEAFFSEHEILLVAGEENLLGNYLTTMTENGERWFSDRSVENASGVLVLDDHWEAFCVHPSRITQIEANQVSYLWDELIERFTQHISTGTSEYVSHPELEVQNKIFQFLAKEHRTKRRFLSEILLGALLKTPPTHKMTRIVTPTAPGEPHYIFLIMPCESEIAGTHEEYRQARRTLLRDYVCVVKKDCPEAVDIIGIAVDNLANPNRSEDIVYLDAHTWTEEDENHATQTKQWLTENGLLVERKMYSKTVQEYPDPYNQQNVQRVKGKDRNKPCPCGSGSKHKKCCGT